MRPVGVDGLEGVEVFGVFAVSPAFEGELVGVGVTLRRW